MLEPEISKRCPACGASIRESAAFCPQCGERLHYQNPNLETPSTSTVTAPLHDISNAKDASKTEAPGVQILENPTAPLEKRAQEAGGGTSKAPEKVAVGKVRDRIQRATTMARDVEGDVIHRVQKVREISSVVLDEAAYDPSLRFVLVACVLFLLFLVIMLLNKLIG